MVQGVPDDHLTGGPVAEAAFFAGGVTLIALFLLPVLYALLAGMLSGLLLWLTRYFRGKRFR